MTLDAASVSESIAAAAPEEEEYVWSPEEEEQDKARLAVAAQLQPPDVITVDVATMLRWRANPLDFVLEALHAKPDPWQEQVLKVAGTSLLIALVACKGPGKSTLLSWLALWFLYTRPNANVGVCSITGANLQNGLAKELALWIGKSEVVSSAFEVTKSGIYHRAFPLTWFLAFRQWAKDADATAQADTLAGFHADYVMWVLDEISEYPDGVYQAAKGALLSGKECRLIAAGNPTRTSGPLYFIATRERDRFLVVHVTGDPDDPNRAPRVNLEEAKRLIRDYGRGSNVVRINVLGLFPLRGADNLLGAEEVLEAMRRFVEPDEYAPLILCVDVARFGDDDSVIRARRGLIAYQPQVEHGLDTMELAARVAERADELEPDAIFVDVVGIGAGVVDRLRQLKVPNVVEVNFGQASSQPKRFARLRDEAYWKMAEWIRAGGSLPDEPLLVPELTEPTFRHDASNRVVVESKEDYRARLGRSPDRADSVAIGFAFPVHASRKAREHKEALARFHAPRRRASVLDYNPLRKGG